MLEDTNSLDGAQILLLKLLASLLEILRWVKDFDWSALEPRSLPLIIFLNINDIYACLYSINMHKREVNPYRSVQNFWK